MKTIKAMQAKNLKENYYIFGNKGNVLNNDCHIAKPADWSGTTLCGTPMLSTNWARINEMNNVGCLECNRLYKKFESLK